MLFHLRRTGSAIRFSVTGVFHFRFNVMSDSKIVELDRFRSEKRREREERRYPGRMVWLHCPKCKVVEYTEIVAPHGRKHLCGTDVEEDVVELDIRAEATIARYNIERIDRLVRGKGGFIRGKLFAKTMNKAFAAIRKSEETYLEILGADGIPSYPGDIEDLKEKLPIKSVNRLGLLISEFRYKPEDRFAERPTVV